MYFAKKLFHSTRFAISPSAENPQSNTDNAGHATKTRNCNKERQNPKGKSVEKHGMNEKLGIAIDFFISHKGQNRKD